ncbi:MAG: IS66 family insertion sequence element accessory protein TnpB [Methylococcaceae bacterium]
MKINAHWQRHVKAWRESGLSQADYCRQQGINPKTFSAWARRALPIDKNTPLDVVSVQVAPSPPAAEADAIIMLRFSHGAQLELSTAVSPRWLAELLRCLA